MKKIWICGAAGMLGSHFTRLLQKNNTPHVANDYLQVDITNLEAVSDFVRTEKITHIINCAGYTHVDKAESEPKQAYLINAIGPQNLAIAARRHAARVMHFSTDYVFDGKSHAPYTEEHPCAPLGAYGVSKWAGEIKLLDEKTPVCLIRTSWLYGYPGKNFVETMLKQMSEKDSLRIVADQVGRPTYCQDLAEVALQLLDHEGIYHFANAQETSWHQFATEIAQRAKALGYPIKVQHIEAISTKDYPTPAQRPAYSTLNTSKIEQVLHWTPRPWQEALQDYLQETKSGGGR